MSEQCNDTHLPIWEPGSGYYGDTLGQNSRNVIEHCETLVLSFLDKQLSATNGGVFTVADYGTNDGFASMSLIESIIREVKKKRGEDYPVQVIYEDQEKNDFNSLFQRLSDRTSYLSKYRHVYPMATNINFYKQCVPDRTCDVIFSCMTTHWLDSLEDVNYKNCVFMTSLTANDQDVTRRLLQIAERDWTKFLLLRARELKPGGLLVVLSLSAFNDYRDPSRQDGQTADSLGKGALFQQRVGGEDVRLDLEAAWRKLWEDDIITQEEFEACTSKNMIRTAQEITSPFQAVTSHVHRAGLSLVHHDQVVYPFHSKLLWKEKLHRDGVDDRRMFARITTAAHRVWSETTFRNSLSCTRSAKEKAAILDHMYDLFEEAVYSADPETYNTDYIVSRLVARKV